jgi:L-ribulose-5-phosphate 4-epimerase
MKNLDELKAEVCRANVELVRLGLVTCTWGNVSGVDRSSGRIVIKPSGVDYSAMTPDDMIVLDIDGRVIDGRLQPSSDTATHLELYKAFSETGGIVHTHSVYATMFAQACREIPCLGTTHADHFKGPIPVTRFLTEDEVREGYELHTGTLIIEHAPFAWGKNAQDAVQNSLIMERVAQMALGSFLLNPDVAALPEHIQQKHYQRKHGPNAYYGQKNRANSEG